MLDGDCYPTVEHAYQAAKTTRQDERMQIRLAESPGEAKRLGQGVDLRPDWNNIQIMVMADLLAQKFTQHDELRLALMATEDSAPYVGLIEGNTWGDTFWGVCGGKGTNYLGTLLMTIRATLIAEEAAPFRVES